MASIRVCDNLDFSDFQSETLEIDSLPELKTALKHRGWSQASVHRMEWYSVDPFYEDEVLVAKRPVDELTELEFETLAELPTQSADKRTGSFTLAVCAARLATEPDW
ncbi:MAG TPA: hypothetical protein PLL78_02050 [Fimbriimonadaceae bacterium]|nr:hypothetical protein [Fimbriimonadaceae bacterium]HRJ95441.1 hypothetical protein [Fimbriimonadaceae bacterium]